MHDRGHKRKADVAATSSDESDEPEVKKKNKSKRRKANKKSSEALARSPKNLDIDPGLDHPALQKAWSLVMIQCNQINKQIRRK